MPNILANGIRIFYQEWGGGPFIVWHHGLFGTSDQWREVADHLQGRYRSVAYDARAHGRSEVPSRPEDYAQDLLVEDVRGVLDALGVPQAVVGGHSMGSNVALHFAFRYPTRCRALVLVGIGSGSTDTEGWRARMGLLADLAEKEGMERVLREIQTLPAWKPAFSHPQLGPRLAREVLACSPQGIARTIRGVQMRRPTIFQLEPFLVRLTVPTLVVYGELDEPVVEASRFIGQKVPKAQVVAVPGVGHWTHLEALPTFLHTLDAFLERVERGQ
ncbi:MAG: alpha/beta hydrolase [Dehalococcoidia bacterium]|nr:alpha/beta hydrolase [Dehalococcoidia bacterium]MDW8119117.1 alpha/beta hydrolase [Chloroflexota bacterium]